MARRSRAGWSWRRRASRMFRRTISSATRSGSMPSTEEEHKTKIVRDRNPRRPSDPPECLRGRVLSLRDCGAGARPAREQDPCSADLSTLPVADIGTDSGSGTTSHSVGTLNELSRARAASASVVVVGARDDQRRDLLGAVVGRSTSVTNACATPGMERRRASTSVGYTVAPFTLNMSSSRPAIPEVAVLVEASRGRRSR